MATPSGPKMRTVQRSGMSLESFDDVKMFKKVEEVAPVTSIQDALARLGNDEARLYKIITGGLMEETLEAARNSQNSWNLYDSEGKETSEVFTGSLVSTEILNPVVLTFARINPTVVQRDGKPVEITWDEAKNADEKRAVKDATLQMIKDTPRIVDQLRKKMQMPATSQS